MRIFSSKSRSKSINIRKSTAVVFYVKLTWNSQKSFSTKKICLLFDFFIRVSITNFKHLASSFTIRSCNNRGMNIQKSSWIKKLMCGKCKSRSHSGYWADRVSSWSQMSLTSYKLHCMFFLSKRISFLVTIAYNN